MTDNVCYSQLINDITKWRITAFTYNINGRRPTNQLVNDWLSREDGILISEIVCIAFQVIKTFHLFIHLYIILGGFSCRIILGNIRIFMLVGSVKRMVK